MMVKPFKLALPMPWSTAESERRLGHYVAHLIAKARDEQRQRACP
jgi:hypothetical protein